MQSPSTLTRALVHELAKDPDATRVEAVRASAAACDYDTAAARVLARAVRGEPFPLADVADVLPGLDDLAPMAWVIATTTGDRAASLLALVEAQRFAGDDVGADQEALALWAAWTVGDRDALRERLAPRVRLTARWKTTPEGTAILAALVRSLGDARLSEELAALAKNEDTTFAKELEAQLRLDTAGVVAALPADAASVRSGASGFTVRSAPKPGRNDPCPCGSGKKYKKCHGAKEDGAGAASPVAGMSWDDYLRNAADKLAEADVARLVLRDLAKVDLAKLADGPLLAAVKRFAIRRRWDLAQKALEALAARGTLEKDLDKHRGELVMSALAASEIAFARGEAEKLVSRDVVPESAWLEMELGEGKPEALPHLLALTDAAVRDDAPAPLVNLALALLTRAPSLGLLVARAALRPKGGRDNEDLLVAMEDARALLHLPGGDVAHDFVKSLAQATARDREIDAAERETEKVRQELGAARAELRTQTARAASMEEDLDALRASLAPRAEGGAPAVQAPASDEAERRALRAKVKELEGVIREGQTERQELRQRLSLAEAARPDAGRAQERDDDDDASEDVAEQKRGILVPRLPRRVELSLPELPQPVAAEALRTIGGLAAGEEASWLRVKQAKDMPRQVLMARLGIHYRLLFRVGDGELEVLDLVPRESLDGTLKRLRSVS